MTPALKTVLREAVMHRPRRLVTIHTHDRQSHTGYVLSDSAPTSVWLVVQDDGDGVDRFIPKDTIKGATWA
jgi:hypothetical protein